MNNKGNVGLAAVVFLGLWLVTSLVWSIWLDGIAVPAVGCITSLAVIGVFSVVVNINR